jgi:hypothetical protein
MSKTRYLRFGVVSLVIGLTAFLAVPGPVAAQVPSIGGVTGTIGTITGTVAALVGGTSIATGTGATALVASTGPLANSWDAVDASLDTGSIPIGTAATLEATAIGEGDLVSSAASLGDLVLTTAVGTISADFTMATATADSYGGLAGWSEIDGLVVSGVPIVATGAQNQTLVIGTIQVVLNEVTTAANGITVNALHVTTLDGLVNVVAGSATAVRP